MFKDYKDICTTEESQSLFKYEDILKMMEEAKKFPKPEVDAIITLNSIWDKISPQFIHKTVEGIFPNISGIPLYTYFSSANMYDKARELVNKGKKVWLIEEIANGDLSYGEFIFFECPNYSPRL